MIVRCTSNTGEALRPFEYQTLGKDAFGRFGVTGDGKYNQIDIGKKYMVMGLIVFETYQAYLIDNNKFISAYPCQLFEIIDDKINTSWHFRLVDKDENIYPFVQSIFGYPELCSDKNAYENLIIKRDEESQRIYYRRKIELESSYM